MCNNLQSALQIYYRKGLPLKTQDIRRGGNFEHNPFCIVNVYEVYCSKPQSPIYIYTCNRLERIIEFVVEIDLRFSDIAGLWIYSNKQFYILVSLDKLINNKSSFPNRTYIQIWERLRLTERFCNILDR